MTHPLERGPSPSAGWRAVAYYRHSVRDRREAAHRLQRERVRAWAREQGIEILQEFTDCGPAGPADDAPSGDGRSDLSETDRPAFYEMIEQWVKRRSDFVYVLCLDASRWGRFQVSNLSALCRDYGKRVIGVVTGTEGDR
jgi:DNA invertase Pin-like site-specific DNA recombinase